MSVVDSEVVELSLDNSKFERNAKRSIALLDSMKASVDKLREAGEKAGEVVAGSIEDLANTAGHMDLSDIEESTKRVANYFTLWGSVTDDLRKSLARLISNELTRLPRALKKATSTIFNLIKSGGLSRALKLEQAQFQLKGIGVSWSKALEDINYGVQDTAYGLDAAAKAASQLSASGVKLGDDMKAALRGISGVAAMTSASYEEIAYVYGAIAGMGRVTAQQLNRLSIRGINAFATLSKYLGKTQAEVRDMVSKGQIDFDTFAKAMDDAFGEHAKDANKTFEGALSNVKAALSRIGAEIATPYYNAARDVLNAAREVINEIKKDLDPSLKTTGKIIAHLGQQIVEWLKDVKTFVTDNKTLFEGLNNSLNAIGRFIDSDAFKTIKTTIGTAFGTMHELFTTLKSWINEIIFLVKPAFDQIASFLGGFASTVILLFRNIVRGVINLFKRLSPIIEPLVWGIADAFGIVAMTVDIVAEDISIFAKSIRELADPIAEVLAPFAGVLYKTAVTIGQVIANAVGHLVDFVENLLPLVAPAVKIIAGLIKISWLRVERIANYVSFLITAITDNMGPVIESAAKVLEAIGTLVWHIAGGLEQLFVRIWKTVFTPMSATVENVSDGFVSIFDFLAGAITKVDEILGVVAQKIAYGMGYVYGLIKKIFTFSDPLNDALADKIMLVLKIGGVLLGINTVLGLISGGSLNIFKIVGSVLGLLGSIGGVLGTIASFGFGALPTVLKLGLIPLFTIIFANLGGIDTVVTGLFSSIKEKFANFKHDMFGELTYLFTGHYIDKIAKGEDGMWTFYIDNRKSKLKEFFDWFKTTFSGVGKTIIETAGEIWKGFVGALFGTNVSAATMWTDSEGNETWVSDTGRTFATEAEAMADDARAGIKNAGDEIAEATKETSEKVAEAGEELNQSAQVAVETIQSKNSNWTDAFKAVFNKAGEIFTVAGQIFANDSVDRFSTIMDATGPIIRALIIAWAAKNIFKPFAAIGKGIGKLVDIFNPFKGILNPIKDMKLVLDTGLKELAKSIGDIAKIVKKHYKAQTFSTYAKSFLLLAASIGVLSLSLIGLSKYVDTEKLYDMAPMITVLVAAIAALVSVIGSFNSGRMQYQITALDALVPSIRNVFNNITSTLKSFKIGSFLKSFAASVAILAAGILMFTQIDFGLAVKTAIIYGAFLAEIAIASKITDGNGFSKFPISFAVSVPILALGIKSFNDIEWNDAWATAKVFASFLAILVGVSLIMKKFNIDHLSNFSLKFAIAVPILSVGVRSFNGIRFRDAIPMLTICGTFFAEIAIVCGIISENKPKFWTTIHTLVIITQLFLIVEGLAITIAAMTALDTDKLLKTSEALSIITATFAGMEWASLATATAKAPILILLAAFMAEIMYGLWFLTTSLTDFEVENLTKISDAMAKVAAIAVGMIVTAAIVEKLGVAIGGLIPAILVMGVVAVIVFGVVGLIALGCGALEEQFGIISDIMEKGFPLVRDFIAGLGDIGAALADALGSTVGSALGSLGGSIVGSFESNKLEAEVNGLASVSGDVASQLTELGDAIYNHLGSDVVTNLKTFAEAVKIYASAGDNMYGWQTVNEGLTVLKDNLPDFVVSLRDITDKDLQKIEDTAGKLKLLGEAIAAIPETSILSSVFFGKHDVQGFADDLKDLGTGLANYYEALSTTSDGKKVDIDTELIEKSAIAAKSLAEVNAALPNTGGVLQEWLGEPNLLQFSNTLSYLGKGLRAYYDSFGGTTIDTTIITSTANAALALAELANKLPNSGGVLQQLIGEKNLGTFGVRLSNFGKWFMVFYDYIKDFNGEDKVNTVADVGQSLADLENSLPAQDGVLHKFIFGEKNIEEFGKRLVGFAQQLQAYETEIQKVDFDKLGAANGFLKSITDLFVSDVDTATNFEQLSTITYYVSQIVDELLKEFNSDKNKTKFQNGGLAIMGQILTGMSDENAKKLAGLKVDDIVNLMSSTIPYSNAFAESKFGENMVAKIVLAITTAIEAKKTLFLDLAAKIISVIGQAFTALSAKYTEVGNYITAGLIKGMSTTENKTKIYQAGKVLGKIALTGMKAGAAVHSPSTEAILIGDNIGEGLQIGLENVTNPVYQTGEILGESVINGINDGLNNVELANPLDVLRPILGDNEKLTNLSLISALKTDPNSYDKFASAFAELKASGPYAGIDIVNKIAKLYGSNGKKLIKLTYDYMFKGWDDKKDGERLYKSWEDLYEAILNPSIAESKGWSTTYTILDALIDKFGVNFEESVDLADQVLVALKDDTEEANEELERMYEILDQQLLQTLKNIGVEFGAKREELAHTFTEVAAEAVEAQSDFLKTINDSNASDEDKQAAYRRLNIIQGSINSLDRQNQLLDQEEEKRRELAKLQNDEAKEQAKATANTSKTTSAIDALGVSLSDTSQKWDEATESVDDFNSSLGDTDEAIDNLLGSFDDAQPEIARAGYDLAESFQDDGWWKSFLDGSESGLAGYDLGSILAGNTISGLDSQLDNMMSEGWDLASSFTQGMEDALNGDFGIGSILDGVQKTIDEALGGIDFSIEGILGKIWEKVKGWFSGLGQKLDELKTKIFEWLESLGINTESLKAGLSSIGDTIGGAFSGAASWVGNALGIDTEAAGQKISDVFGGIGETVGNFFTGSASDAVGEATRSWLEDDGTFVFSPPDTTTTQETAPAESQGSWLGNLVNGAVDTIVEVFTGGNTEQQQQAAPVEQPVVVDVITGPTGTSTTADDGTIVIMPVDSVSGSVAKSKGITLSGSTTSAVAKSSSADFTSYKKAGSTATSLAASESGGSKQLVATVKNLDRRLQNIQNDIKNTDMYLDSGALVGGTTRAMSKSLSNRSVLLARGV